jgi:predicted RNase H-like HicB family nuclease
MDAEAFLTVTATFLIAISCGVISYRVSIRQAKQEIDAAFQQHIERMHQEHRLFVEEVVETVEQSKD